MPVAIREISADDLAFAVALKEQAGWNQTRGDLQRFRFLAPQGWFVAECDGAPAGTVIVFEFGRVAWIAMMLVEKSLRGRGIGRALMDHALEFAESRGAVSLRLDATPLGQPLYEKLGFVADYALTRYGGTPQTDAAKERLPQIAVEDAAALDLRATGANRRPLLAGLWEEQPGFGIIRDGETLGFHLARQGSNAVQIGPCIADPDAGAEVLSDALRCYGGQPLCLDIPDPNELAIAVTRTAGLLPQRTLLRMTRGRKIEERVEMIWSSSGPEKG